MKFVRMRISEIPRFPIPLDEVSVVKLNHMRGKGRFGIFEDFRIRALVVDVGMCDAQGGAASLGQGRDVFGFVMVG